MAKTKENEINKKKDFRLEKFLTKDPAKLLKEDLTDAFKELTIEEQRVLSLRYGLYDGIVRSLEEVKTEMDLPIDEIQQIEAKAIRKLRYPNNSNNNIIN